MKHSILAPLLAASLALPAAALAQTCTSPNATSDYIVGEAEGRPSAMHWRSGLVWSRCIEGMAFNGSQCSGGALADIQKEWLDWISTQGLLPLPFDQQADWGISASLTENRLHTGTWRLPYRLEYRAVMDGCPDDGSDQPVNQEVLPTIHGQGGIHGWHWSASPRPGQVNSAWVTYFNLSTGGSWLSNNYATEARVVRGGQPFASLPAGPFADTRPAGTPWEFTLPAPLASQSGTGAAWGGARIGGNGRIRVNGTGNWVREAIVKSGDQISVRLLAPATEGQQAAATLTLRSGQTTGTAANATNGGDEDTVVSETSTTFTLTASASAAPRACRVTPSGSGDGTTWAQAASLAGALADFGCEELWLQQATGPFYEPVDARGFFIERNVRIYGGFLGTENALADRPAPVQPDTTVLDGGGSKRLLYLDGTGFSSITSDTLIDGLTLKEGSAGAEGGGALYCNGAASQCSPRLNQVIFYGNKTNGHGAAMYNDGSQGGNASPVLTNALFRNNQAGGSGGGVYNHGAGGTSSPTFTAVSFENNTATAQGGALYNEASGSGGVSSPVLERVSFSGNHGNSGGGAMTSMALSGGTSHVVVRNATFGGNSTGGSGGGAIGTIGKTPPSSASLDVTHATFMNNRTGTAPAEGANALFSGGATVQVNRSVLWDDGGLAQNIQAVTIGSGSTTITDSLLQGGCAGGNQAPYGGTATCTDVLDSDPLLPSSPAVNVSGFPELPGYLPAAGSPVIDAMSCAPGTLDQRGVGRPQGAGCDFGALERRGDHVLTVTLSGSGTGTVSGAPTACTASPCNYTYRGEVDPLLVTLTATPSAGHTFTGWSGACSGTGACTVTMDQARTVGAGFASPVTYTIGGSVSGLTGTGLVLRNNGSGDLSITSAGPFTFAAPVAQGGAYAVTVHAQPVGQTCTVTNGSGTASADVTGVLVSCAANTYAVSAMPPVHLTCTPAVVTHGGTATCNATPPAGQATQSISGCYGSATGAGVNTYTTGPVTGACTVTATFAPLPTHTLGGSVTGLTSTGLVLRNGGESLPVAANGAFTFTQTVADGGSYDVTVATQPSGQRCTVANASGSNVSASVNNVQVACAPYFEGTTVPASGAGGTGSATFTGGGPACRFDLGATGFEAAPATLPQGRTLPQGVLRVKLVGCTAAVAMEVTWPEPVAGYTKHGLAASGDTQPSYFAPAGLTISGRTVRFTLTDGQQGDDDWTPNGEIADPSGPTALAGGPGGAQPIPTLGEWGVALLSALLGLLALRRRAGRV